MEINSVPRFETTTDFPLDYNILAVVPPRKLSVQHKLSNTICCITTLFRKAKRNKIKGWTKVSLHIISVHIE